MLDVSLNRFKFFITQRFFIEPADANYFLARFCRVHGFHEEFWWQSLQAIEKYLKAGLVLNGKSVKKLGHDLIKNFKCYQLVFSNIPIQTFQKPPLWEYGIWNDFPIEAFLQKIDSLGNPDTRYGMVGYLNIAEDIFKLDQLSFELRRRSVGLDWIVGKDFEHKRFEKYYGKTYLYVLKHEPNIQIRNIKIPDQNFSVMGNDLSDAFYSWNYAYFRNKKDLHRPIPISVAPKILGFKANWQHLMFAELEGLVMTEDVKTKINWMIDNIKLSTAAVSEFRKFIN